jgi:phage N-6-adenine-methyltransferase
MNELATVDIETGEILNQSGGEVAVFDPSKTADYLIGLDAVKARAIRMKDWPTMELAIAEQIQLQQDHVTWWRATVRGPGKVNYSRPGIIEVAAAEKLTGITVEQTSKWAAKLKDSGKYQSQLEAKARKAAGLEESDNHRAEGTGENEWYTPVKYIEAARKVLGVIELDPASSSVAQATVKAERFFTRKDNGLKQEWFGRVWLNPPYTQPEIWEFCKKLTDEVTAGNVTEAILLTHNYTDTAWFHYAEEVAAALCFTRGRIAFEDQNGDTCAPTQGQAFFYFGDNGDRFSEVFMEFGFVR